MIGFFLYLIVTLVLIIVSLPYTLCFIIKKLTKIDTLKIKMYTFTYFKSFLLKLPIQNSIWGIQSFILSIPDIQLNFNIKTFRLTIIVKNLQAFFVHFNNSKIYEVNIIDGLMEPNLVGNLLHFVLNGKKEKHFQLVRNIQKTIRKQHLKYVKKQQTQQRKSTKQTQQKTTQSQTSSKGRLSTLLQGGLHFVVMMIVQFLQLKLIETTVSFVSSVPQIQKNQQNVLNANSQQKINGFNNENATFMKSQNRIDFSNPYSRRCSLLLLRHLSEQTLKIPEISAKILIINHYQEQIQLECPKFQILNWSHPTQPMVKGKGFFLGVKIPVTLNISESLKSLQYGITVESLQFNTVPADYVRVMQIIKSFSFSLDKLKELYIGRVFPNFQEFREDIKDESSSQKRKTSVSVSIQKVDIVIQQLYEINVDEKEAQEYLENISEARFGLRGISFQNKQFRIDQSEVKINKFRTLSKNTCNQFKKKEFSSSIDDFNLHKGKQKIMLMIPNLLFSFYQKSTNVSHNPTQLYCGREQLALLSKIFRVINDRMRFDELTSTFYMEYFTKYIQYLKKQLSQENVHKKFESGIKKKQVTDLQKKPEKRIASSSQLKQKQNKSRDYVSLFCYLLFQPKPVSFSSQNLFSQNSPKLKPAPNSQPKSQQHIQTNLINKNSHHEFIYQPSSLTFRLLLQNLEHTLYLPNCSYKQLNKLEQFQHILTIPSLDLNYNQIKQFGIKQLKMIFRQIPTFNQFALFVQSIAMKQNQQTLVEYLSGWIVLKKLLQITSEQRPDHNSKDDPSIKQTQISNNNNNKKLTKKTITIRKFDLDYQKQTISIKKIQLQKTTLPNGKNIKLYFSIDKLQFFTKFNKSLGFNLKKVPMKFRKQEKTVNQAQNLNKDQFNIEQKTKIKSTKLIDTTQKTVEIVHNLFSFDSLTVSVKLQNVVKNLRTVKYLTIEKQKSLIHLKNPQIVLPHFDISQKIFTVFQSYVSLKPHISAYIKDKTQDEFIKIKRNIKDFLIEPDMSHFKVTNFSIILQQEPMNIHLTNYHRFIRNFLSKVQVENMKKVSQIEVISFLRKNKQENKLCKIAIKQIQCEIQPLTAIAGDYRQSVEDWIMEFNNGLEFRQKIKTEHSLPQNKQIRLRKVQAAEFKFSIKGIQITLRDYPQSILNFTQLTLMITSFKTMNIFNLKNYYFKGNMRIGKMVINTGLNMLSGFLQIKNKIDSYISVFNKFQNTSEFAANLKKLKMHQKHNLLLQEKKFQSSYQPWWYILLHSSQWKFSVLKQTTKINLYTGTIPYEKQCFQITLGDFRCDSELNNTQFVLTDLNIKLLDNSILELKKIESNFAIRPDQRRIFHTFLSIFAENAGKITLSRQTVHYISTLKQLRNDWLILYGFFADQTYEDDQLLHKKNRMNYLEIINYTANKMIEEDDKNVTFLSAVKEITLKVEIKEFNLILTNYKQGVNFGIQEFVFCHQVRATKKIKNQWQTLMSSLQILRIWGSLLQKGQQTSQNTQRITQHVKQNQQNMFLGAKELKLNFNKYKILRQVQMQEKVKIQKRKSSRISQHSKPTQIVFIRKFMEVESIKLAMSLKIKKSIQRLIRSYSPEQLKKQFEQKVKKIYLNQNYLTPIQRFKSIVQRVIRINKLRRRKLFGIRNFFFFAQLKNVQFVLISDKSSIIVDSKQNVRLDVSKIYKQDDINFTNPITRIFLKLRQVQINLIEVNRSNIVELLTQGTKMSQEKKQKKMKLSNSESIKLLMHLQSEQNFKNSKKGHSTGQLTFQNGLIQLTQKTKSILAQMIDFFIQLADDKEKKRIDFKKAHQKFNQLQNNGRQLLKSKIQQNYKSILNQKTQSLSFKWIFQIKNTNIELIVPVQQKIKFEMDSISFLTFSKPFIKIYSQLIKCELNFFSNQKIQRTFQVNDLNVQNLLENQQHVFRKILSMNHNENLALYATIESYDTLPLSEIVWEYFSSVKIHCNPIKFRVTQKLFQKFYEFLFPEQKYFQTKQESLKQKFKITQFPQNYEQRFIPDFIKKLETEDLKVQVWYETESLIKRMEGISVKLNGYKVQNVFMTKKQLFDDWVKFVLKQMTGQIFNVLGQKLFGNTQDNQ